MKAFLCLTAIAACATAAPQIYRAAPVYGHAGQTSHQSVTKADGEVRSVQVSKAFGAGHAAVHQVDNSKGLAEIAPAHGAVLNNGGHAVVAAPVFHGAVHGVAHHAPAVVAHAAPLVHHAPVVHHAPAVVAHAAPLVKHVPVAHAAAPYDESPAPYAYEYGVADDYSKAAFNAAETADGSGAVTGSYTVALPDGRTQRVSYTADGYNGYVADVTYEGVPVYPEVKPYVPVKPAPAYHA